MKIIRNKLRIMQYDMMIPSEGSANVKLEIESDGSYSDYVTEIHVGYFYKGSPKEVMLNYQDGYYSIPGEIFVCPGPVSFACHLSKDDEKLVTNTLVYLVKAAPGGTIVLPSTETWEAAVNSFLESWSDQFSNQVNSLKNSFGYLDSKMDVLDSRMDTMTSLPFGSTIGDAELADIRVGFDGKTYENAGSAVRGQVSQLSSEIDYLNHSSKITVYDGSKLSTTSGSAIIGSSFLLKNKDIFGGSIVQVEALKVSDNSWDNIKWFLFEISGEKYKFLSEKTGEKAVFDLSEYDFNKKFVIGFTGKLFYTLEENINIMYEFTGDIFNVNEEYTFMAHTTITCGFYAKVSMYPKCDYTYQKFKEIDTKIEEMDTKIEEKTAIIVAKDGSGDFETLNEALTYAKTYMSRQKEVTVLLYPGVYEEVVNVYGNQFFSIVGVNKETCIIRDDTGVYNNCPLRIEGNSYVANITLISTHKKMDDFVIDGIVQKQPSYALHIDDRHADNDEEYVCTIFNCKMYSEQNPAIGIGLDKNQTVNIIGCEIVTNKTNDILNATGASEGIWSFKPDGGALFYHALYSGNYTNDEGYQRLVVKDCVITNNAMNVVFGEAGGMEEQVELTFINNSGWSDKNGATFVKGLARATISPLSHGNNMDEMNYQEI